MTTRAAGFLFRRRSHPLIHQPHQYTTSRIAPQGLNQHHRNSSSSLNGSGYTVSPGVEYDAIVIGGGHNGLVCAAYLSKAGMKTLVLERRHILGGAAVTEEIVPGYKFSRASYLAGLLRPQIIEDLQLHKFGFKYLPRDPSSFTPTKLDSEYGGKYLMLGDDADANWASIAQFSERDADNFVKYEKMLGDVRELLQPLLDNPLPDPSLLLPWSSNSSSSSGRRVKWGERVQTVKTIQQLGAAALKHRDVLVPFYELLTGPAQQILDRWFESDILKTTLATDAVIGALLSPQQNGSAYVLLHHVMGEAAGKKGVWAYVEGGMGAVSEAIAAAARSYGADIVTSATVEQILTAPSSSSSSSSPFSSLWSSSSSAATAGAAVGVRLADGSEIRAKHAVISAISPHHTFLQLMQQQQLEAAGVADSTLRQLQQLRHHITHSDFSCGAFKINCAVNQLPNFTCYPNTTTAAGVATAGPMHRGTIHFEYHMRDLLCAYKDASEGRAATRPVIEMTIPSSLDNTLLSSELRAQGHHVVQLFVQYAPYNITNSSSNSTSSDAVEAAMAAAGGSGWAAPGFKDAFADRCCAIVDEFCPGFSKSVVARDVLSPLDLENIFALPKGNIFHGSLSIHQLGFARPMSGFAFHRSPLSGLYMGASGTHPGGGVMGAPGRNCAQAVLHDCS